MTLRILISDLATTANRVQKIQSAGDKIAAALADNKKELDLAKNEALNVENRVGTEMNNVSVQITNILQGPHQLFSKYSADDRAIDVFQKNGEENSKLLSIGLTRDGLKVRESESFRVPSGISAQRFYFSKLPLILAIQ